MDHDTDRRHYFEEKAVAKAEARMRRLEDAVLYLLDRADTFHKHEAKRRQEPIKRPERLRAAVEGLRLSIRERGE